MKERGMAAELRRDGYELSSGIWMRPGYGGIAYSDGDETETRIASIVASVTDLSVLSVELRAHCTDWPSTYHLSSARANLLRPFERMLHGSTVLEIGAGCGAITRYLGEAGASVLALEGSERRARVARARTRDLCNVDVIAEKFEDFRSTRRFDCITLIGVLEYAHQFSSDPDAAGVMLQRVAAMLRPGGRLILAIENQLGLKYFAGAPEDHLGVPMLGVEGLYAEHGPRTFGRHVLERKLQSAGLAKVRSYAPFPDYKLPVSVVTPAGWQHPDFDAAALASQATRKDPQLPQALGFALERTWPLLEDNGIASDLSNSLLIVASNDVAGLPDDETALAYHYSTARAPEFCKETVFRGGSGDAVEVVYRRLTMQADDAPVDTETALMRFDVPASAPYLQGHLMHDDFASLVARDGWHIDDLGMLIVRYLRRVGEVSGQWADQPSPVQRRDGIDGACVDMLPQNIMILADGSARGFDCEWVCARPIAVEFLLFRVLLLLVQSVSRFGAPAAPAEFVVSREAFFLAAMKAAGYEVKVQDLTRFGEMEAELQATVSGLPAAHFSNWWRESSLPTKRIDQVAAVLQAQVAEQVAQSTEHAAQIEQQATQIERQAAQIEQQAGRLEDAEHLEKRLTGQLGNASAALAAAHGRSAMQAAQVQTLHSDLDTAIKLLEMQRSGRTSLGTLLRVTLRRVGIEAAYRHWFVAPKIRASGLFDPAYYLARNPDVAAAGIAPLTHYMRHGWRESRDPGAVFSTRGYLSRHADVRMIGANPLTHYVLHGRVEGRSIVSVAAEARERAQSEGLALHLPAAGSAGENDSSLHGLRSRDGYLLSRLGVVPTYLDPFADEPAVAAGTKIAVHVHLHYADMLDSLIGYLSHIPCPFDLFVSTCDEVMAGSVEATFRAALNQAGAIHVAQVPNRGRDVAPMLLTFGERLRAYDVVAHFHTKKSPHSSSLAGWYDELMEALCGSRLCVAQILALFASDAKFVYFNSCKIMLSDETGWSDNLPIARALLERSTTYDINDFPIIDFPQGTMFWASGSALQPLLDLPLQLEDFPSEPIAADGTLAHAVERLPLILAHRVPGRNYRLEGLDSQANSSPWYEDQFDFSEMIEHPSVKVLAYYLPQFHATPENDEWHGAGFTEWHKVRSAQPLFVDHYQQHVPHSDIGYYSLEDKAVFSQQLDMMHMAGVHGLIFYHYWFAGRRILERPAQMLLNSPEIAMPYCFCWANENWTRRWDGNEKEILLGQSYSDEDARAFITDLIPYFRDPRYITIDGRPVLFVYRPSAMDDAAAYVQIWGEECERHGVARPYLAATLTRGAVDAAHYGMDAASERVLHDWTGGAVPELKDTVQAYRPVEGSVLDYGEVVAHYKQQVMDRSRPLFRSLVPTWDNTPRYGSQAIMLHRFNTRHFQDWLEFLIADAEQHLTADRRFVIVNAWNEWAEGAHLEPDRYFGYGYLNAIGRALSARRFDDTSYFLHRLQRPVRLRLNLTPTVYETLAVHPASRCRFLSCLAAALAHAPVHLLGEEPFVVEVAALAGIGIDAAAHEAEFTLDFRSACLFQEDAVRQLLAMALRHAGYGISANVINLPDFCSDPHAQNAAVGYWQRSGMTVLPVGPVRGFKTSYQVGCLHLDPVPTVFTPERFASLAPPARVSTVVRYHARGDRRLLLNALLSLLAQEDCEVQLILMVQDIAAEALESLSAQVRALPWAESCPPIIRSHYGTPDLPDLRALLLHEGLSAVGSGCAAILDYDDVLYPWAYRHLAARLASTGKNATFGRVYTADVDAATGMVKQRRRVYDYGGTFDEFFFQNHAPIHSFMLNLDLVDLATLRWFDDMRYMEDYFLTLQVFHPEQTDWASLETTVFIGDYNHRIGDKDHTLAVDEASRSRLLDDPYYQVCEEQINEVRATRRHLLSGHQSAEG